MECRFCKKNDITVENFAIHEAHCESNYKICTKCNQ